MITRLNGLVTAGLVTSYTLGRSAAPKMLDQFFCMIHISGRDHQGRGDTIEAAIDDAFGRAKLKPSTPPVTQGFVLPGSVRG
jgi:hypothetical protein